jgi:hypothetical protein
MISRQSKTPGITMVEPFSLAAIGGAALTEGIKFLYDQVGDWFKSRRARDETAPASTDPLPVHVQLPPALGAVVLQVNVPVEFLDTNQAQLMQLRAALANYYDGTMDVDPADATLVSTVSRLRDLAESAIGERLTFVGEDGREPSGTVIRGAAQVARLDGGRAIGVDIDGAELTGIDTIEGRADVQVATNADVIGTRIGRSKN